MWTSNLHIFGEILTGLDANELQFNLKMRIFKELAQNIAYLLSPKFHEIYGSTKL